MGMNTADVITLMEGPKASKVKFKETISRQDELRTFARFAEKNARIRQDGEIDLIRNKVKDEINAIRVGSLTETGSVFELINDPLTDEPDDITLVAQSPKVKLKDAHALCDALGFVIIPFSYLKKEAYAGESYKMRSSIERFMRLESHDDTEEFQPYVLAPLGYYDVDAHIRSDIDMPIYSGRNANAFISLSLSIPALRTITRDLAALTRRVDGIEARLRSAEDNIKSLARSITELQKAVTQQQQELVMQRADTTGLRAQLEKLERDSFMRLEPMALLLPPNVDINGTDGWAAVGPVWGPDMDDIIMEALKLKRIEGQRKMIEAAAARFCW